MIIFALIVITLSSFYIMDGLHDSIWHFLNLQMNCNPCYCIESINAIFFFYLLSGDLPDIDADISDGENLDLDTSDELKDTDLPMQVSVFKRK